MDINYSILAITFLLMRCGDIDCFICNKAATSCETSLIIEHYATMLHPEEGAVYAYEGQLWKYDVTNTSEASPINIDEVIVADGSEKQQIVVVANKSMPGPDIIVYEGQMLIVHVHNQLLSDSVAIHWHGIPQKGTPYMDGAAYITQCPILAGQTFTYTFQASPKGTYWYHAHIGTQRARGLFGALIIRERQQHPLNEHIIQIQGWNHDVDADLLHVGDNYEFFVNKTEYRRERLIQNIPGPFFNLHSGLINGKGRYINTATGKYNEAPLKIYEVNKGESYRFRVIGVGATYVFRISVDNHQLEVIESDGYNVRPVVVESIFVSPGERFDFLLHANQTVDNFWIRGETYEKEEQKRTIALAILRYQNAPNDEPKTNRKVCTESEKCTVLNCPFLYYPEGTHIQCMSIDELKSDNDNDPAPEVVDGYFKEFFLDFFAPSRSINGLLFKEPTVSAISQPSQVNTRCKQKACFDRSVECKCTHSLDIHHGDTVQLVITNMGPENIKLDHNAHLHGHSFYVLKVGYPTYNRSTGNYISDSDDINCGLRCNNATWSNISWSNGNIPGIEIDNPIRKDTIFVPLGGYVVVRFKADNPGLWLLHCHFLYHAARGMSLVFNESFSNLPKVPDGFPVCYNFPSMKHVRENFCENSSNDPTTEKTKEVTGNAEQVDGKIESSSFWAAVGVLGAVIFCQLLIIVAIVERHTRQRRQNIYVFEEQEKKSQKALK